MEYRTDIEIPFYEDQSLLITDNLVLQLSVESLVQQFENMVSDRAATLQSNIPLPEYPLIQTYLRSSQIGSLHS